MRFTSLLTIVPLIAASELVDTNGVQWDSTVSTQSADTGVNDGGALMPFSNPAGQSFLEGNKNAPGVGSLKNGLQMKICERGTGQVAAMPDNMVTLHYASWSAEEYAKVPRGEPFDSSFKRGMPAQATPKGIILGIGIALTNFMVAGDIFMLYMPSKLAYGEEGSTDGTVPPGTVVVTHLKVISVDGAGQDPVATGDAPVGGCDPLPSVGGGGSGNYYGVLGGLVLVIFGIGYFAKKNENNEELKKKLADRVPQWAQNKFLAPTSSILSNVDQPIGSPPACPC